MAVIQFFEKPGCTNNNKQKALLRSAGHELIVHDLLHYPWTEQPEYLRSFFGALPVADWFNRSAPDVKNGVVLPERLDEQHALALMLKQPLLIRRPLLDADGQHSCGFDPADWASRFATTENSGDLEHCPQSAKHRGCNR
jgi:nitrogenase-associated protein